MTTNDTDFICSCYACGRVVEASGEMEQTQSAGLKFYALGQIFDSDCDYQAGEITEETLNEYVGRPASPDIAASMEEEMNKRLREFADESGRHTVFTA